jgi:O-antigen/teichoic acid export membrane protein
LIKNIIHTLSSRFMVSFMNLALLFITTRIMGAENKGEISLLILNLSLAAIFSGLFGGPSLVYLIPRFQLKNILILNYGWSTLTAGLVAVLSILDILPSGVQSLELFCLALLECLIATHLMIFLGQERVKTHNWIQIIKASLTVGLLFIFYYQDDTLDARSFVTAYGITLAATYLASLFLLSKQNTSGHQKEGGFKSTVSACLKYGSLVQIGNISQLLNYRLSFYFLELLITPMPVALVRIGIYSASLQVAEALWQFAKSISTVQYSKVSNTANRNQAIDISLKLGKLNYFVTGIGIIFLLFIPSSVYGSLFGAEFGEIKKHFMILAPGIFALSLSNALSHYFAGVGQHRFNTQSSILGLVLTIFIGYFLILKMGTLGAAVAASVVYTTQTFYQLIILVKTSDVQYKDLILGKEDFKVFIQLAKEKLSKN